MILVSITFRRRRRLEIGLLPLLAWLATTVLLMATFAYLVPSLLTIAMTGSVVAAGALVARPGLRSLRLSLAMSVVVIAIGIAYRAGPTSGFQEVNASICVLAAATAVLSAIDLLRASRGGSVPGHATTDVRGGW